MVAFVPTEEFIIQHTNAGTHANVYLQYIEYIPYILMAEMTFQSVRYIGGYLSSVLSGVFTETVQGTVRLCVCVFVWGNYKFIFITIITYVN